MDTTTTEDGATPVAQPSTNVADDDGAMVITTDESGTPTMVPVSEATAEAEEVTSTQDETTQGQSTETTQEEAVAEPTQADDSQEIVEWAKKKGLEINPDNPNEVKLAKLQLENDRRFHESK